MQHNTETKIWNATLYLRLSRDDGDKEESNSITGQRELLRDFIRTRPELREYAVRIDDGFTGSNFERPSFKKMLEDVKAGRTNCIIAVTSPAGSKAQRKPEPSAGRFSAPMRRMDMSKTRRTKIIFW